MLKASWQFYVKTNFTFRVRFEVFFVDFCLQHALKYVNPLKIIVFCASVSFIF